VSFDIVYSVKCCNIESNCFFCFITGAIDPSLLLEQIEAYVATVKEEAFSRKDILERVERWLNACEEEAWLEDYRKVRFCLMT
jgi:hypothetical protein